MGGDYSRSSFDALRDYAGVLLQQGHPTLDADWNELVAIVERRMRAQTVDTIGRAVVPIETPTGFEIQLAAGPALTIGRGRMYVDGLLAENHGRIGAGAAPVFDRSREIDGLAAGVLDELISSAANDFISYAAQPYLPVAPALPATNGPHLAYLDVWRREVTPLKDPRLLEPALGGIDTATRWQTVWQVRLLADVGAGAACGSDIAAWDALIAPSPARLTTATIEFEDPDEPCLIPPGGGYRGLENQLYRVEIHTGGALGAARFKWSRDNGSVGATIETIDDGDRLEVRRIGRDSVLRFSQGDWVEITDDRREFAGLSGDIRQLTIVDEDSNTLTLNAALSADLIPAGGADTAASRRSRVIKWDQSGQVLKADGTIWEVLDAGGSDGLIPVPADGSPVMLEAGVTVSFAVDPAGDLRALDHWGFAARTEGAQIEILDGAPPIGIHHHYARLALVTFPATVIDCRIFWPPDFGQECGCTVCVSADGHNDGTLTIQAAIDQLPDEGGTVCLGPGDFLLGSTPVAIAGRKSVRLRGHGSGSLLAYAGAGGAVRVSGCNNVRISDLGVHVVAVGGDAPPDISAIYLSNNLLVDVQEVVALVVGAQGTSGVGIALDGYHLGLAVSDNAIFADLAIASLTDPDRETGERGYCALLDARFTGNIILSRLRGFSFPGAVLHLGPTSIAGNSILAGEVGVIATGTAASVGGEGEKGEEASWSPSALTISANAIGLSRGTDGIVSGVPSLRVLDNDIAAGNDVAGDRGSCIRLVEGILPAQMSDAQLVGNRLGNVAGFGLSIEAPQKSLLVKRNVIRDCGGGAITMDEAGRVCSLSLDNNLIERVAMRELPFAVAVRLAAVAEARVIGNTLRRVGFGSGVGGSCAAFDLDGVPVLDFAHNVITEIGVAGANQAVGLHLAMPVASCSIASNRISDDRDPGPAGAAPTASGSWCAIHVGNDPAPTTGLITGLSNWPKGARVTFVYTNFIATLGNGALASLGRAHELQIRISGNLISDAHSMTDLPLVNVLLGVNPALAGACAFADNQCLLNANGRVAAIAILEAPRVIASNNLVRRRDDTDAMHVRCAAFGKPMATIIGNLSFGRILLNGQALPPEFSPLNVTAP